MNFQGLVLSWSGHPRDTRSTQGTASEIIAAPALMGLWERLFQIKMLPCGSSVGRTCWEPQAGRVKSGFLLWAGGIFCSWL